MKQLKNILLVEDSAKDVELTLAALDEHRLANRVVVVHDGVEALDFLYCRGEYRMRPGGDPAVVLLDLKMPKLSGIEVLRQLKSDEAMKGIPVVMLTSSRENSDLEECYRLGVNAYVVKPVEFPQFIDAVKQVGAFWALLNELPGEGGKQDVAGEGP